MPAKGSGRSLPASPLDNDMLPAGAVQHSATDAESLTNAADFTDPFWATCWVSADAVPTNSDLTPWSRPGTGF
eukprot:2044820-Rhodomonas_salina.2